MPPATSQACQEVQGTYWPGGPNWECGTGWSNGPARSSRTYGSSWSPRDRWTSWPSWQYWSWWESWPYWSYWNSGAYRFDRSDGLDTRFNDRQDRYDRCDHPACCGHRSRLGVNMRSRAGSYIWGCVEYHNGPERRNEGSYARLGSGRRDRVAYAFHGDPTVLSQQ
jgi:hypothetical protein